MRQLDTSFNTASYDPQGRLSEMASKETQHIDISEIHSIPDLVRIAEEVQKTGEPRILKRDQEDIAQITPVKPAGKRRVRGGVLTKDDPLFRLIGIAKSGIPGGISGKKHEYLGRALRHP
ncbi:MAG: hypothetical protein HW403_255 [Dehalococcoidia bacterium]|nr:hypothetical protein [Dehalococcoidia bacterium]